jgi:nickel/cobalt transporter (NicO) family protein
MKNPKRWTFGFLLLGALVGCIGPASAHAPDEYGHNTYVSIGPDGVRIEMRLTPGPLVGAQLDSIIDTNHDQTFSDSEITAYGQRIAADLTVSVDGVKRSVTLIALSKPTPLEVRSGAAELVFTAIAAGSAPSQEFSFADDHQVLRGPAQISVLDDNNLPADLSIDRSVPRAITVTGTFAPRPADTRTTGSAAPTTKTPSTTATTRTKRLQGFLLNSTSFGAVAVALGVSALLGALHALTPGHGKTIAGAYLIGEKATVRHAIILGLSVTITHTSSVLLLGAVAIGLSDKVDTGSLTNALRWGSGLLVLGIGLTLLIRRIRNAAYMNGGHDAHQHGHGAHTDDSHSHGAHAYESHSRGGHSHGAHAHDHPVVSNAAGMRRLVALGASGGLIPCPEALGVLIVAVSLHRQLFGMAMIISFSVGLASVLVAVGIALVRARKIIDRFAAVPPVVTTRWLPIFSAAVVSLLGVAILSGHVV